MLINAGEHIPFCRFCAGTVPVKLVTLLTVDGGSLEEDNTGRTEDRISSEDA